MQEREAQELWNKYKAGTATPEEEVVVMNWFHSLNLENRFDLSEAALEILHEQMDRHVQQHVSSTTVIRKTLWPRIAAAAAVLLIIGSVLFFYSNIFKSISGNPASDLSMSKDIAPGKNTATLTLANGKTINLSDAKTGVIINASNDDVALTYNDGSKVRVSSGSQSLGSLKGEQSITGPVGDPSLYNKQPSSESPLNKRSTMNGRHPGEGRDPALAGNSQLLTATTPRGGQYTITLPDGTKVWLNAESSIKFPSTFSGLPNRTVELFGEAYFEVFKNKKQPFTVISNNQQVEVLGTHFNINSYADEGSTKTTLLEGSVRVTPLSNRINQRQEITLKPGQQSENNNGNIKVTNADLSEAIAWKNGEFMFNDEPLENIMRKISRWYDVTITYKNVNPKDRFGGTISRFENVSKVLEKLELTGELHFIIEGRKITVTK